MVLVFGLVEVWMQGYVIVRILVVVHIVVVCLCGLELVVCRSMLRWVVGMTVVVVIVVLVVGVATVVQLVVVVVMGICLLSLLVASSVAFQVVVFLDCLPLWIVNVSRVVVVDEVVVLVMRQIVMYMEEVEDV